MNRLEWIDAKSSEQTIQLRCMHIDILHLYRRAGLSIVYPGYRYSELDISAIRFDVTAHAAIPI